jgi:adenylosuccinate synthase
MPTKLVLGLQHGDEGKGRVVDDIAVDWADVVVRFQGGGNAGHTVYDSDGNKHVTHILPVGVIISNELNTLKKYKYNEVKRHITNVIARGCVLNVFDLYNEIKELNIDITPADLQISGYCPLIEPTHILIDRLKYQGKLGTTARGIGPAYSDFYARDSILFKDLIEDPHNSLNKMQNKFFKFQTDLVQEGHVHTRLSNYSHNDLLNDNFAFFNSWTDNFLEKIEFIKQFVVKDESLIIDFYNEGKNILLEGAQGCGLNIHSNNYPDVTSSAPTVGGALNSTGLNHNQIDEVIGVIKAYKTKVGTGTFPSLCDEQSGDTLAKEGNEFGATTGRPRKCGWLDLDEVNQAIKMNGVDHLCLIKTDVFTNIEKPFVYYKKNLMQIAKINTVSIEDKSFVNLLEAIKDKTGVNRISFTTGPKRGEIVWD